MLQIEGIRKVYKTGNLVQEALKGVSLSLRDNEFVAILGQSGSGKTTLLNIIGGLDRYDDGNLIINGVSTKRYSDRDWDSYRNHTVGFVFQSYNLIPHQTVLKNVELALTISGISANERARRATEALKEVGLEEHIHKKPSQLSGGQMQRVAIARALVNDPDILLADEPTGALDSDTSIQVMDLLQKVAEDRLVVMVTHNPELAEQYATRIVTLKDGEITSDSDPFTPEGSDAVHKNLGKSSMSLLTSLQLSFNNLWTKKARTILVAFAGSIGIIGIAMILAMSNGANEYIRSVEEDSLQDYPLQITDTSFNLTSMYADSMAASGKSASTEDEKSVEEWRTITNMFSGMNKNDLKSLKAYFESDECDIDEHVQSIEYDYNIVPRIYRQTEDVYRQVNPDTSFSALGFSGTDGSSNGLLSTFTSTDSFFPMSADEELFQSGFDLKAGKWPESYNECVLALSSNGRVSDMSLYAMGLKDPKELEDMINKFSEGKAVDDISEPGHYEYDDFIGIEFRMVSVTDFYTYDKSYEVWTDHSSDKSYVKKTVDEKGEPLKIVGVIQPNGNNSSPRINIGIGYPASLTQHIIDIAKDSQIVKDQIENPDTDVFTGKSFDDKSNNKNMDFSSLFSVDSDAITDAFNLGDSGFDLSAMDLSGLDFSGMDLSGMDMSSAVSADDFGSLMPQLSPSEIEDLLGSINFSMTSDTMKTLFTKLLSGYERYAASDSRADLSKLPSSLRQYLTSDDGKEVLKSIINDYLNKHSDDAIKEEDISAIAENLIAGYPQWLAKHNYELDDYTHIAEYMQSDDAKKILTDGANELRKKVESLSPTDEELNSMASKLVSGYESYADSHELPSASYLLTSFTKYLATDEATSLIKDAVADAIDTSALESTVSKYSDLVTAQLSGVMTKIISAISGQITSALQSSMASLTSGISDNLLSAFDFNTDTLADLFKTEMTAEELKDLMVSLLSTAQSSYDGNLRKLGYADLDNPSTITIYPKDFDSKQHIKDLISDYNDRMKAAGDDDKVIEYTDIVDALMGSITMIINAISYVLIAFVAVSLVVSSIMIGVITYISVLERKKEIGILRAIGASKRNISQVFNAETFIIGALAGVIGVGITALMIIPANAILHSLTNQQNLSAILPPAAAGILILLSIVLTLIGGIIPSRKAAKSDPVTALRSE
ncbi:ABC transporter ATP-binding protein/permease [Ruminococcus sp.]|uniref:ABC transporter ATP-binding protein/permease n=1 Tax=Ruminococcus sp. TaxID=41978 RepID=UPI002E80F65D|nr:ABC transporter ATP-binding protein/permease [Ruminococcus sp.]MEE3491972.1 ABC transporter ATP-binding protein/permease [Ruminococcus sp.]